VAGIEAFAELTLETRDLARCERFYREAFGLVVISRDEDRVWLAVGRHARLGLWTPGRKEFGDEGGRHVHFAFVASPGTLDELARGLGEHSPVQGPVEHPGGDRSLYVRDPEGNVVEVWDFFHREPEGVEALR
jgi:catechol-2,3-dioxygenase